MSNRTLIALLMAVGQSKRGKKKEKREKKENKVETMATVYN